MRCLGRTETDRKITNEPWSSKQSLMQQGRPLFGVKGMVCAKKEKKEQKFIKKVLTRAGIVRDALRQFASALRAFAPLRYVRSGSESGYAVRSCTTVRTLRSTPGALSGRTMARIGLRMMPPFPSSPLSFRTADFLQSGWKAGNFRRGLPVDCELSSRR